MRKIIFLAAMVCVSGCTESEKVNVITGTIEAPQVIPPNCPDWTGSAANFRHESNFGCANRNNMGQMVAEPMDMVAGRGTNYYGGKKTAAAVSAYSNGAASSPAAAAPAAAASSSSGQ